MAKYWDDEIEAKRDRNSVKQKRREAARAKERNRFAEHMKTEDE